jgi:hypothetical protein
MSGLELGMPVTDSGNDGFRECLGVAVNDEGVDGERVRRLEGLELKLGLSVTVGEKMEFQT